MSEIEPSSDLQLVPSAGAQQQKQENGSQRRALTPVVLRWTARRYVSIRNRIFDREVMPDIKAEVLVGFIALIGIGAWLLKETIDQRRENSAIRMQYIMSRYEKRDEAAKNFADGIPKNAACLTQINLKRLFLQQNTESIYMGRPKELIAQDYRSELTEWRNIPHYSALCTEVIGRFGAGDQSEQNRASPRTQIIRLSVISVSELFNAQNEISLDPDTMRRPLIRGQTEFAMVIDKLMALKVADTEASQYKSVLEDWTELNRAIVKHLGNLPPPESGPSGNNYQAGLTTIALINEMIDLMQILALRLMHADLAEEPKLEELL